MGEMVTIFIEGQFGSVLSHWFFYVTLVLLLCCMAVWLGRLNAALRKYDPIFIIPLVQAHYIIFSILSGGFFFEEFALVSGALAWSMFILGIVIMMVGLAFLAPRNAMAEDSGAKESTPLRPPDSDTSEFLPTYQPPRGEYTNGGLAEEGSIWRCISFRNCCSDGAGERRAPFLGEPGPGGRPSTYVSSSV